MWWQSTAIHASICAATDIHRITFTESFATTSATILWSLTILGFDWNRCLYPEWVRLGIPPIGRRGFCCLMMARRLALEAASLKLDDLKTRFALSTSRSHHALNDVQTLVELFKEIYQPRLVSAGFDTFDAIAAFASRTPVAWCANFIRETSRSHSEG